MPPERRPQLRGNPDVESGLSGESTENRMWQLVLSVARHAWLGAALLTGASVLFSADKSLPAILVSICVGLVLLRLSLPADRHGHLVSGLPRTHVDREYRVEHVLSEAEELESRSGIVEKTIEMLAESERRYRSVVESAHEVIGITDPAGVWTFLNPAWEDVTGFSVEESLGRHVDEFTYPEDIPFNAERFAALIRGEVPDCRHEVRLNRRGGGFCWVEMFARLDRDENGEIVSVSGNFHDVTERKRAEEALSEMRSMYHQVLDTIPDLVLCKGPGSRILWANQAFREYYGMSNDELNNIIDAPFAEPDITQQYVKDDLHVFTTGRSMDIPEEPIVRHDGRIRLFHTVKFAIKDRNGEVTMTVGVSRDVTERKNRERSLSESEELFRHAFEGAPIGMTLVATDLSILRVNRSFCRMLGYTADEIVGRSIVDITFPEDVRKEERQAARLFRNEIAKYTHEKRYLRHDGGVMWGTLTTTAIRDESGQIIYAMGMVEDITERKEQEAALSKSEERHRWLAQHDPLTELPNRSLFYDRLERVIAESERNPVKAAVLLFDLDRFKHVNDTLGHDAGDRILREAAARLKQCLRPCDTLARMGGDEFIVLLSEIDDPSRAVRVAERLLAALTTPFVIDDRELFVNATAGISVFPSDGRDAATLLRHADTAMHRAKEQGRGSCRLFAEAMNVAAFERLILENSLRRGLERGEFLLYYQPQVSMQTGDITGAEALIRWQHPEMGMVSPDRFIPLAEETGFIVEIGAWVVQEAARQAAAWHAGGYLLRVAINLSAVQFRRCGLAATVDAALKEAGVDSTLIELELTESAFFDTGEEAAQTMQSLKSLGVTLAVDDFGTGYSSLSYLRRLPLDVLKIDRVFVRNLPEDSKDEAVVRALLDLAHALDMRVVAEGVETQAQWDRLRILGCDSAQGYLFCRPMPAEELTRMLETKGASRLFA